MTEASAPVEASQVAPVSTKVTPEDLLSMYESEPTEGQEAEVETAKLAEVAPKVEEKAPVEDTTKIMAEQPVKAIKAKLDDKDIEIPEEATITQTINGKEVNFKTKDAIQAFVKQQEFNRQMDNRVRAVTEKERALTKELAGVKTKAVDVVNAALKGDFFSAIRNLAKVAAGKSDFDVVSFEKAYLDQLEQYHTAYTKMTPEQREKFFAERKASAYEEENKQLKSTREQETAQAALVGKVSQLCEGAKVEQQEFWDTFASMVDSLVGEGKSFRTDRDILPEHVMNQIHVNRHVEKVLDAAKKVNLSDDAKIDEVIKITLQQPDLSTADIAAIIEKTGWVTTASQPAVETLNRKAEKSNLSAQFKSVSSTKKANGKGNYDKEDLDFLTRHAPKQYGRISR